MTALHSRSLASRDDLRGCTKWTIERSTITRKYAGCSTAQPARCVPIDEQTVGVTDGPLSKAILAARPMYDFERIVFKPILGQPIAKATFSAVMRAVGQDARASPKARRARPQAGRALADAGYLYLQQRTRRTPGPYALTHRVANRTGWLKPLVDGLSSRLMTRLHRCAPSIPRRWRSWSMKRPMPTSDAGP